MQYYQRKLNFHKGTVKGCVSGHKTHLVSASERRKVSDLVFCGVSKRGQLSHELNGLRRSDNPHVVHFNQSVDEGLKPRPVMRLREPGRVVKQPERSPVGHVVALEVLHEELVDVVGRARVAAGVRHRASAVAQIVPHD